MSVVSTLPPPGAPRDAEIPRAVERRLDNGLRVIAFEQRNLPLISAQLFVRCGAAAERDEEAGLSALTAALLMQGTQRRSAPELAAAVDALGARLDAGSGYDASVVTVSATTPAFPAAFALLDEVARLPAFAEHEVERVRAKSISDLALTYANPSAVARLVAQRTAYGDAPYGHPLAGTPETLATLDRARIGAFHAAFYRPDDAALVIGGDLTIEEAFALTQRELGGWEAPNAPIARPAERAIPRPRSRIVVVDKPDAGRTALAAGRIAIERRSPDYYAGVVATAVLSGYSGRLNTEVRVKRGLSYGAAAALAPRRLPGLFLATTLVDHARVAEATQVVRDAIRSLVAAPPSDEDLQSRKAVVTGAFYRGIETIDGLASQLADHVLYDVPLEELQAYPARVQTIDAARVVEFAARVLVEDAFVVLAGDAAKFEPALAATHGEIEHVPAPSAASA